MREDKIITDNSKGPGIPISPFPIPYYIQTQAPLKV